MERLREIYKNFNTSCEIAAIEELASGHINDTFLIKTTGQTNYILQRINHLVFKNVPGLINNKVAVSQHLLKKKASGSNDNYEVLQFVPAADGNYFYQDEDQNYWNMMIYIPNSVTYEIVPNEQIAYEGGKLTGYFLNETSDLDASLLIDVIPNFHNMSFRFQQFNDSLKGASEERLKIAEQEIEKVLRLKNEMHIIQNLKENKDIPIRVTHNDTKISNVLFDKHDKGLCMIDTDTVMPGIIHYDFGDAIRTICNTASEDEKDLSKVHFNLEFYKSYLKGFLTSLNTNLTAVELEHLPLAAKTMIFIMALRFLTDYLNNDIYYKTSYEDHNLVRAKNQFKLLESLTLQYNEMKAEVA